MTEPLFLNCRGFDENVVLTVKNCFYEEEMRKILIEKSGEKITYHDRSCTGLVPFEGANTRLVSIQCNTWFNSLEQLYFPQINTTTEDFDIFDNEFEGDCIDVVKEKIVKNEVKDVKTESSEILAYDRSVDVDHAPTNGTKVKSERFECDICGLKFIKKKSLGIHKGKRHKIEVEEATNFTCSIEGCESGDRNFANVLQYKKHMRIVHKLPKRGRKPKQEITFEDEGPDGPKACDVCGKIFDTRLNLCKHVKRSHETKQKPCHICGMMVKELSIHVKYQHVQKDLKKYFCEFCGRGFKGYSGYQFHVAGHTGEKKYTCGGCGKNYRTSSEAKKCERGHQGIYKWNCSLCSYRCHQRNKFIRHMRTHTKSEPYGCPLCDHRSARKDYLQKHITKTHTGLSLEQIEGLHPDMYNIEEKITFIEGRESRSTEDILERVRESRLNLIRSFEEQQEQEMVPQHHVEVEQEMVRQEQEFLSRGQEVLRVEQEINNRTQELLDSQEIQSRAQDMLTQEVIVNTTLGESPENLIMRREVSLFKI
eukprot:GFUD01005001.1.p1 GENE.GFUD01005001.1~~GFUD01005001.1.p1  ORF type:complete len:536 (+),score=114.75 GFUD01005001.1:54-1661(+)